MTIARSILLFLLAALAEIGGAWLVWQGVRGHRGWLWIGAGSRCPGALRLRGDAPARRALRPDPRGLRRGLRRGIAGVGDRCVDGFRPDRWDVIGAGVCLVEVSVIMYAPRPA